VQDPPPSTHQPREVRQVVSHQQPNGAMVQSPSVAAQPQSSAQVSSDSSELQVPSPQSGATSQRLQSPMPILHLAFFQKLQSSEQAPQSLGQLAQVSPPPASQLPSLLQTKVSAPAH